MSHSPCTQLINITKPSLLMPVGPGHIINLTFIFQFSLPASPLSAEMSLGGWKEHSDELGAVGDKTLLSSHWFTSVPILCVPSKRKKKHVHTQASCVRCLNAGLSLKRSQKSCTLIYFAELQKWITCDFSFKTFLTRSISVHAGLVLYC